MDAFDVTNDFANIIQRQGGFGKDFGDDDHNTTQARLFWQVTRKQLESLSKDTLASTDIKKRNIYKYWETEGNTWNLMEKLYSMRLEILTENAISAAKDEMNTNYLPDGQEVHEAITKTDFIRAQELMQRNRVLAECVEVRRWLEETAPEFQPVETRKGYLFYTRRNINSRSVSSPNGKSDGERVVNEVDPDAPSRQKKELVLEDSEYEGSFLRTLYEYVRRGNLNNAMALCVESDEPWRAASLKGGLFWRDPKLEQDHAMPVDSEDASDDMIPGDGACPSYTTGNINRYLWKQTCAALAQDDHNDLYERALYAAISGRLDEVILVCETWEDYVWAYMNTMIEDRIDQGIKQSDSLYTYASVESLSHIKTKYSQITNPKQIFDSLSTHESTTIKNESNRTFHKIQTAIILDTFPKYISEYADELRDGGSNMVEANIEHLRFIVHAALYLRNLGFSLLEEDIQVVLEKYIGYLAKDHRELVALYTSQFISGERQIDVYSRFLQNITDPLRTRLHLLKLAEKNGLDVEEIARRTTELILSKHGGDNYDEGLNSQNTLMQISEPAEDILANELKQVRSIEWITFRRSLYAHSLVMVCRLARKFLLDGHMNSATQLFNSLPEDFVQKEWVDLTQDYSGNEILGNATASSFNEYIHLLSLCDAFAYYSTWAETLYKKPVNSGRLLNRARFHKQHLEWKENIKVSTERAIHMFRDRILDVNWLSTVALGIDSSTDDSAQLQRISELSRLRTLYIPETVFRLHSILFDTRDVIPQNLKESLDLAQLVAGDALGIYNELAKQSPLHHDGCLTRFIHLMRQSALEMLKVQQESQTDGIPLAVSTNTNVIN